MNNTPEQIGLKYVQQVQRSIWGMPQGLSEAIARAEIALYEDIVCWADDARHQAVATFWYALGKELAWRAECSGDLREIL